MLLRAPTKLILLALLAACQSTSPTQRSPGEVMMDYWMAGVDQAQLDLKSESMGLRKLLLARGMPSSSEIEVAASLSALKDSVAQLDARMGASGGASERTSVDAAPVNASAPVAATDATGGLEALKQALLVLEEEHAIHCENIANAGTTGYKRRSLAKTTTVHEATGLRIPKAVGVRHVMTQGVLERTGRDLDFAIEGEGYFEVILSTGALFYTRDGSFRQEFNGRLVTVEGHLLTAHVSVPPDALGISVDASGMVFRHGPGSEPTQIGTIRLHTFASNEGLVAVASTGFVPSDSSGQSQGRQPGTQGTGTIRQGYIERSNVNITDEMIALQLVERQAAAVRQALASYGIFTAR